MKSSTLDQITTTIWKGYKRFDFELDGREALIIEPETAQAGKPWIWRTEFFDAFAEVDMAMLAKGWHLAYYRVSNMYGCPQSIDLMRRFQAIVEDYFHLAKKAVLFGFSRGGLYAFNYAARYPDKIAALYLDAPVLDIRSWPGGMGKGCGARPEWLECIKAYGLTNETVNEFKDNPLDKINTVVAASIPIIIVAGDSDEIVPYTENGAILVNKYQELGGIILEIVKHKCGHHPHSLIDPEPVVRFLSSCYEKICL